MSLGQLLFLMFLLVPLIEIYFLIQVGSAIGAVPTIGLVVLTAVLGSAMLRHQGLAVLREAQASMDRGVAPARALLDGVFLVIGGALLLTPGFFTDAFGFACLLPAGRAWLVRLAMRRLAAAEGAARAAHVNPEGRSDGPTTIEGEWRREDDSKNS